MGRMSLDTRSRVIYLHQKGWKLKDIQSHLKSEDLRVSKTSLSLLIAKYRRHHTVADLPRPPKQKKLSLEHLQAVDEALANDDEISTAELCSMLEDDYGVKVSAGTIQRAKKALGTIIICTMHTAIVRYIPYNTCSATSLNNHTTSKKGFRYNYNVYNAYSYC